MNSIHSFWLRYFSQPPCDRALYRAIRRLNIRRILEFGIGDLRRGLRMIRLAQRYNPAIEIRYIGVDLFEAASNATDHSPALSLKQAHRTLRATGVRAHLIPADAVQSMVRMANALPGNELVIVSNHEVVERMGAAWQYVPRMLTSTALLYSAESAGEKFKLRKLPPSDLRSLAPAAVHRRAA